MKVAVTYENGEVFPHFGRTPQFKIYEVEDREVKILQVIDTGETGLRIMQKDVCKGEIFRGYC